MNRRLFISWVGLRGAVPIVFAKYPMMAGLDKAGMIFNLVFFISMTSVLLQGTTLPLIAKWLRVTEPPVVSGKEAADAGLPNNEIKVITLNSGSTVAGKKLLT